jgi:hypothetical protein
LPEDIRERLALADTTWRLTRRQWWLVRTLGRAADHLGLPTLPAELARRRVALPAR